jgi:hypothetical protein
MCCCCDLPLLQHSHQMMLIKCLKNARKFPQVFLSYVSNDHWRKCSCSLSFPVAFLSFSYSYSFILGHLEFPWLGDDERQAHLEPDVPDHLRSWFRNNGIYLASSAYIIFKNFSTESWSVPCCGTRWRNSFSIDASIDVAQQAPHLEISPLLESFLPQIWVENVVILVCPPHVCHGPIGHLPTHNLGVLFNMMLGGPFPSPPHSALSTSQCVAVDIDVYALLFL